MKPFRLTRRVLISGTAMVLLVGGSSAIALAADQPAPANVYQGCLSGGILYNVSVNPSTPPQCFGATRITFNQTGPIGPAGPQGVKGDTGAVGPIGATGPIGLTGPTGSAGAKGDTGALGPTGATGPTGPIGPVGAPGAKGDAGAAGPAGATGPIGLTGPVGPVGATGPQGPAGPGATQFGDRTQQAEEGRGTECTIGEILLTAGQRFAVGVPARGQLLPINSINAPLFSQLGTTYGGNGSTTFALPDLTSAAPNNMTYSICDQGVFPVAK